ncbi:hypothetical protein [Chondromyces apiculatus]|uniref:Uncharacterized protein n=1 Tax=Chondromyces apiculatus DSM 436 TaxID=1192034 RepID=A0A017TGJ3_9BACT|nr:hypothetical protein [Chondromyces apiculatus]EYF08022.1 Hypothetical protein CAP_7044 [Chondromyces apiculatus DSM 436]
MTLYELSIDEPLVREAERLATLEGRGYPTLVMRWESRLFDQTWSTTLVLDYLIALPPLIVGQAVFNEVRIAAFTGGAGTKFMYFGTEMSANVPRVAPEMENTVAPSGRYQEYRLDEQSCPVPYLKLIQVSPRIYGNGLQDYYSPPIKIERYDAVPGPDLLADFFPSIVADLDPVKGSVLTDAAQGFWTGSRYVGTTTIAILRQGKVVGLLKRSGKVDKDPVPPEVKRRDPRLDVLREWVAIDVGASTTVVALRGERSQAELVRIGAERPLEVAADNENPSEISFEALGRVTKAWRERVIQPLTRWSDVVVGHAARAARSRPGPDQHTRAASTLTALPLLRERLERKEPFRMRGNSDADAVENLRKPAPPIIDEDGIGAHDPFDPLELYAYYIGLHVNHRQRGLHTRYAITMPTGWSAERRTSVLVAFRRGLYRSLPAGLCEYHDLKDLVVADGGPSALAFAAHAFRVFGIQPKDAPVAFCAIDAGASETGIVLGNLRSAKPDERADGLERVIEYLDPSAVSWLGGERLLHRMAYRVYAALPRMQEARIVFERPVEEPDLDVREDLLAPSPEGRANVVLLKDHLRPLLEQGMKAKLPETLRLLSTDGSPVEIVVTVDRGNLGAALEDWFLQGVQQIKQTLAAAITKIGREPEPYQGLRVVIGGRLGMHPLFLELLEEALPQGVHIHKFREPDKVNVTAPTAKTSTAFGTLALRLDRIAAMLRVEKRENFRYRVGRARHGQLYDVLDPQSDYDEWRDLGACTKPDVDILFLVAEDDGEVAADDPRVHRASCALGPSAVGQRLYLRAIGPSRVEVAVGPPGDEPPKGGVCWAIDLKSSTTERVS